MENHAVTNIGMAATFNANAGAKIVGVHKNVYRIECRDKDGRLKWVEEVENIIPTVGLNALLSSGFANGSKYVGLKATGSPAAGDTMASHAGWAELSTQYNEANRPAWTYGSVAGGSVDNSANKAVFSINTNVTVYGAFLCDNSTKDGTSGTLLGVADFGASRACVNGDTLNVTVTCSVS